MRDQNTRQMYIGRLNINHLIKLCFMCSLIRVFTLGIEMHMFNSCIYGHDVCKDFLMLLIGLYSGKCKSTWSLCNINKERKFGCWTHAQKNSAVCLLLLWTETIAWTVISIQMTCHRVASKFLLYLNFVKRQGT